MGFFAVGGKFFGCIRNTLNLMSARFGSPRALSSHPSSQVKKNLIEFSSLGPPSISIKIFRVYWKNILMPLPPSEPKPHKPTL